MNFVQSDDLHNIHFIDSHKLIFLSNYCFFGMTLSFIRTRYYNSINCFRLPISYVLITWWLTIFSWRITSTMIFISSMCVLLPNHFDWRRKIQLTWNHHWICWYCRFFGFLKVSFFHFGSISMRRMNGIFTSSIGTCWCRCCCITQFYIEITLINLINQKIH